MKFAVAVLVAAFVCVASADQPNGPPSPEAMIKMIADDANAYTGTVDAFKAATKEKLSRDPGVYTLDECNKFLDEVCKLWKATFMKCADFKEFVLAEKKALGKCKA
jgi:hypothetical protein